MSAGIIMRMSTTPNDISDSKTAGTPNRTMSRMWNLKSPLMNIVASDETAGASMYVGHSCA